MKLLLTKSASALQGQISRGFSFSISNPILISWALALFLKPITSSLNSNSQGGYGYDDANVNVNSNDYNSNEPGENRNERYVGNGDNFDFPTNFILTSTHVDRKGGVEMMNKYLNPSIKKHQRCYRLDLFVPSEYDPLLICLLPYDWPSSSFHRNFSLVQHLPGGKVKVTTLDEFKRDNELVKGFVISFGSGQSHVQGQIINGSFYGTVLFSQPDRSDLKMCNILPLSELYKFLKIKTGSGRNLTFRYDFDEDELEELKRSRTRKSRTKSSSESSSSWERQLKLNGTHNEDTLSIVTCEGTLMESYLKSNLNFNLHYPIQNRRRRSSAKRDNNKNNDYPQQNQKVKRDAAAGDNNTNNTEDAAQNKGKILVNDHRNYKYLTVDFYVDPRVVRDQFGNDTSQMIVALSSYVEMTDWITRAHDFSGDGVPDNFGFKFSQVEIGEEYTAKDNGPDIYKRLRQFQMENFYDKLVNLKHVKSRSVNVAIVPIDNPLYLHLAMNKGHDFLYDGCTACSTANILDGLINPRAERYEPHGEMVRMLYATMHILIASVVYTKTDRSCMECTDLDQWVESDGGDAWGACLVEGMLFDSSNIPLNAFKLSKCTQKLGLKCVDELGKRKINGADAAVAETCVKVEIEESYCGNGIVEPGEECDCGTLAACDLQKCECGPRNGVVPCMKLSSMEQQLCQDLIKCRGYRVIYEMGQMSGSHFLESIPALLQSRILDNEGQVSSIQSHITLALSHILVVALNIVIY